MHNLEIYSYGTQCIMITRVLILLMFRLLINASLLLQYQNIERQYFNGELRK